MQRPKVLVATTNQSMAFSLASILEKPCLRFGLKLEICPGGTSRGEPVFSDFPAYTSAGELFDYLDSLNPTTLLDTMIILDTGAYLVDAFKASVDSSQTACRWHQTINRRTGVAIELLLRYPQVFPVFLSPAVPYSSETSSDDVIIPEPLVPENEHDWSSFSLLRNILGRNIDATVFDFLFAVQYPLHFVSAIDDGRGLRSSLSRFARGMRCIFDPTGLRTLVKLYFLREIFKSENTDKSESVSSYDNLTKVLEPLKSRLKNVAIAIDEEREFAFLNAYTAYKFGRRSWMVTTFDEFDNKPLWVSQKDKNEPYKVIILRDIDMRFPDIPEKIPTCGEFQRGELPVREQLTDCFSEIWQKYCYENQLIDRIGNEWRVRCVSSDPGVRSKIGQNFKRLGQIKGKKVYLGLTKPLSSIYDLTQLFDEANTGSSIASRIEAVSDKSKGGHGAPYLNLAIAESLLIYSEQCTNGPVACLLSALLASEAYELLLGMSSSTALEALRAMHKGESMAEVSFVGVSHDLKIKPRKEDIKSSLKSLLRGSSRIHRTKHIFLSQLWAELRIIYRNGEQFNAAEEANLESLVNMNWTKLNFLPNLPIIKMPLLRTATSFKWWTSVSFGFSIITTTLYALHKANYKVPLQSLYQHENYNKVLKLWHQVVISSLQVNPSPGIIAFDDRLRNGADIALYSITLFHYIISYILLGMFISMLFRKITRS